MPDAGSVGAEALFIFGSTAELAAGDWRRKRLDGSGSRVGEALLRGDVAKSVVIFVDVAEGCFCMFESSDKAFLRNSNGRTTLETIKARSLVKSCPNLSARSAHIPPL